MLQVARLSPRLLGDAAALVADYLRGQQNPDGGFRNRAGDSDLYYTVFGIEGLLALRADLPFAAFTTYLASFGTGAELDLVHLACLARAWAALPPVVRAGAPRDAIVNHLERYRSADGGYHAEGGAAQGTIYGCFLALGVYQDLEGTIPQAERVVECVQSLRAGDGGYANQHDMPLGLTPSTAAAVAILRQLRQPVDPSLADWLLARCHADGGFFATPLAPIPDLLSTATALHALAGLQADLEPIKEPCLDFVDSLWTNQGAFYGQWADDAPDCEYTYYALLALGHLSL